MFKIFLEVVLIVIALSFVITQIALPIVLGGKLFPAFRSSRAKIEHDIRETEDLITEKQLKEKLEALRAQLKPSPAPTEAVPPTEQK